MDDLSAFGQLVESIVPQVLAVAIFDHDASLCWASDPAEGRALRPLALDLYALEAAARASGLVRARDSGLQYAYAVVDSDGALLGALGFTLAASSGKSGAVPATALAPRLAPLLKLLTRDLGRSRTLANVQQRLDATAQIQWTLEAMHDAGSPDTGVDPIETLLRRILAKLEVEVIVVNTGDFQFEQLCHAQDCRLADVEQLREIVGGKLLHLAQTKGVPLRVNKARAGQGGEAFRLACVPLRHRNAAGGVLAVFRSYEQPPLTSRDTAFLERLAPRIAELIENRIDPATGLPTRIALEHYAPANEAQPLRLPRCVVYLDIDQMHVLNELFGFATGDLVLRRIAALWPTGRVVEGGMIGRLSGDRFAAVLDHCTLNQGWAWAETARRRIEALELAPPCRGFKLSASFGVAVLEPQLRFEAAVALAATACRAAKDRGRNRVELFSDNDKSLLQRQDDLHIFRRLLAALEARQVRLHAQPMVPLGPNPRPTHYELLVRLLDEQEGEIEPEKFLSAAKRYQLLPRLDRVVVERALAELAHFAPALEAAKVVCWINLSGLSLGQPDFTDWLRTAVKGSAVPGHLLGFEITEGAAIENLEAATRFISRVKDLGCHVSLDDFGTGFSSLAYLKSLAVSALKIDGGFVRDILTDPRSLALVTAVLEIARQLGLDTVAEFVESGAVATRLTQLGVTYGQGYYFARPRALADVLQRLPRAGVPPLSPPRRVSGAA